MKEYLCYWVYRKGWKAPRFLHLQLKGEGRQALYLSREDNAYFIDEVFPGDRGGELKALEKLGDVLEKNRKRLETALANNRAEQEKLDRRYDMVKNNWDEAMMKRIDAKAREEALLIDRGEIKHA